jgi:hypothetical protein
LKKNLKAQIEMAKSAENDLRMQKVKRWIQNSNKRKTDICCKGGQGS